MTNEKQILQIRNGIYILCLISIITLIVGVSLNIFLNEQNFARMKSLAAPVSTEQTLINELNELLESNKIAALIARCNAVLAEKPLSRTGHYYLGLGYYHSGDASNCRKHLEEALRIDPTWSSATEPYLTNQLIQRREAPYIESSRDESSGETTCPECGETHPGTFAVCWNCGTALEA